LLAAGIVVVCAYVAYAVSSEIATGQSVDGQVSKLQTDNARLLHEIAQRRQEIADAQTRAWVEEEARKLGFVVPGERVYVVVTPGAPLPPGGGIDVHDLPTFSPSPSPGGTPVPTPTDAVSPASPSPTPFAFTLPTPSPRP
jgi:cell division protein FtsB